jgi:hypothetical protein
MLLKDGRGIQALPVMEKPRRAVAQAGLLVSTGSESKPSRYRGQYIALSSKLKYLRRVHAPWG